MKMKVTLGVTIQEDFDVEFPLFRELDFTSDDGPGSIMYSRIDLHNGRMKFTSISYRGDSAASIDIDEDYVFPAYPEVDHLLGLGKYSSSELRFNEAAKKAKDIFSKA